MQPGSGNEEVDLQQHYRLLSTRIAQVELEYNQAGVIFYILTIIDDRDQGADVDFFQEAFWADKDNTYIPAIHQVRRLREQARVFLRASSLPEATRCLEELDDLLDDLAERIIALEMHVTPLGSHMTIPCTKDSLLHWSPVEELQTVLNHPRFREWVLQLPEIEHGLALGILENANQAVRSMLRIEDRFE